MSDDQDNDLIIDLSNKIKQVLEGHPPWESARALQMACSRFIYMGAFNAPDRNAALAEITSGFIDGIKGQLDADWRGLVASFERVKRHTDETPPTLN